jgi:hypothetical protein
MVAPPHAILNIVLHTGLKTGLCGSWNLVNKTEVVTKTTSNTCNRIVVAQSISRAILCALEIPRLTPLSLKLY